MRVLLVEDDRMIGTALHEALQDASYAADWVKNGQTAINTLSSQHYDLVLQNFPSGNKAAAAQLKKGFALLESGKEDEGTQELRHVIQRYPKTNEATQARERLRKAGGTSKSR